MPLREDLRTVLVVGSGPIVLGQAAEFDYSGTQACRAVGGGRRRGGLGRARAGTLLTDPEVGVAGVRAHHCPRGTKTCVHFVERAPAPIARSRRGAGAGKTPGPACAGL